MNKRQRKKRDKNKTKQIVILQFTSLVKRDTYDQNYKALVKMAQQGLILLPTYIEYKGVVNDGGKIKIIGEVISNETRTQPSDQLPRL